MVIAEGTTKQHVMIKTTLTFQDSDKLQSFVSSQELSQAETDGNSLSGYFDHEQIETAAGKYGATVLQNEDGRTASDAGSTSELEPLL
jgi:hypothetical protein